MAAEVAFEAAEGTGTDTPVLVRCAVVGHLARALCHVYILICLGDSHTFAKVALVPTGARIAVIAGGALHAARTEGAIPGEKVAEIQGAFVTVVAFHRRSFTAAAGHTLVFHGAKVVIIARQAVG